MARDVMILRRATSITRPLEGVSPENVFGPVTALDLFLHLVGGSGPEVARVRKPRGWVQYSRRPTDNQCPQCGVPGRIKFMEFMLIPEASKDDSKSVYD